MKKISIKKATTKRSILEKLDLSANSYDITKQSEMINKLYLKEPFPEEKKIRSQINTKLNSYKKQDRVKSRYNEERFITMDETVELLVASKMKCHYCCSNMYIFYQDVREPRQWTLDRVNNDIGHYGDNVVISCLECNLKRRRTSKDGFLFTKQLKLVKKN